MLRPIFLSFLSTFATFAVISEPTENSVSTLAGGSIPVSEEWIRASTPSSNSTKTPKSVTLTTLPFTTVPTLYFSGISFSHGSGVSCFMPSEMRSFSMSIFNTTVSTFWPFSASQTGVLCVLSMKYQKHESGRQSPPQVL